MPISTISQTISTIPEAGHRGVDVQTTFVNKQEDFQDHLQGTTVSELNALKTQINTTVAGMNDAVTNVNTKANEADADALSASNSAGVATTKAGEASTSASQASASATKASQWADNNYNVEVEAGKYSAKHWSVVAQNIVNNKIDKVTSTDNALVRFNGTTGDVQNSGVIVDDMGRVGLGTATPTTTLDVVGDGRFQQQATSGTSGAIIIKEDSGSVNGGVLQWVNPANTMQRAAIKVKPDYSWEISNGNNPMFKISSVGDFLATLGTGALGYGTGAGGTVTQLTSKGTSVTLNKPTGQIIMNNSTLAAGASVTFGVANSIITTSDNIIISHQSAGAGNGTYFIGIDVISNGAFGIYVKNTAQASLSEAIVLTFTIIKGATA